MRTKKDILKDYLIFLNETKNLGYSLHEIEKKVKDQSESQVLEKLLLDNLYETKKVDGQIVSTTQAFKFWCDIVIRRDIKTGDLIWNNFVKDQFELVENHKLSCYMAARGHGKSFFLALYISFKMFLIPYYDVGYCSNIPKQRRRFLKLIESIIDSNGLLRDKKDIRKVLNKEIPWGQEEMEYNQGLLEGTTVGTTPRGGHYNLAIGDDPLRDDKKYTYEFIVNYFQGVYKQTILRKKGRYIIVGTPQDPEDLFHTLMNNKLDKNNRPIGKTIIDKISAAGFFCKIFPGILNFKKKMVLVPEIWSFDELLDEMNKIGEIRFNREIMCKCMTYKNSLVSSSLFRSCCDDKLSFLQKGETGKKYIIFVDPATSDAPTADYLAMSVWEDNQQENKFILRNLFHEKGFPITDPYGQDSDDCDQAHKLLQLFRDFNKAVVVVEKNNAGVALIQAVRALGERNGTPIDPIEHYTHTSSISRQGKADDVISYIEAMKSGIIVFPSNPEDIFTISALEEVKAEHLNFGAKSGKSGEKYEAIAGHDDIFDSCWGAYKFRGDNVDTIPCAITIPG